MLHVFLRNRFTNIWRAQQFELSSTIKVIWQNITTSNSFIYMRNILLVRSLFRGKTDSEYGKAKIGGGLFWRAIGKKDSELTDDYEKYLISGCWTTKLNEREQHDHHQLITHIRIKVPWLFARLSYPYQILRFCESFCGLVRVFPKSTGFQHGPMEEQHQQQKLTWG